MSLERGKVDLGIDLGTTKCAACFVPPGGDIRDSHMLTIGQPADVQVPKRLQFRDTLPSVLYVNQAGTTIVGAAALERAFLEPQRAVSSVKLWLGKDVRLAIADGREFMPFEVVAEFLAQIITSLRDYENYDVGKCIITVPSSFDIRQKLDTVKAAEKAGIVGGIEILIDEPIAAFLGLYAMRPGRLDELVSKKGQASILIVDLGGGTLDISAIRLVRDGSEIVPIVLATSQRSEGAGDQFDEEIAHYLAETFIADRNDINLQRLSDQQRISLAGALLSTAREMKHSLADQYALGIAPGVDNRNVVFITESGPPLWIPTSLDYAQLAAVLEPAFALHSNGGLQARLHQFLTSSQFTSTMTEPRSFDLVLLVGQMSKLWLVKEAVEKVLPGILVERISNRPEHDIARGAAVQASRELIKQQFLPADLLLRRGRGFYALARRGEPMPIPIRRLENALQAPQGPCYGMMVQIWQGEEEEYDRLQLHHEQWVQFPAPLDENDPIGLEWSMGRDFELNIRPIVRNKPTMAVHIHAPSQP